MEHDPSQQPTAEDREAILKAERAVAYPVRAILVGFVLGVVAAVLFQGIFASF